MRHRSDLLILLFGGVWQPTISKLTYYERGDSFINVSRKWDETPPKLTTTHAFIFSYIYALLRGVCEIWLRTSLFWGVYKAHYKEYNVYVFFRGPREKAAPYALHISHTPHSSPYTLAFTNISECMLNKADILAFLFSYVSLTALTCWSD